MRRVIVVGLGIFGYNVVRELYENGTIRTEMQKHSRVLGRPEAAEKVIDIAMSIVKDKSRIKRV